MSYSSLDAYLMQQKQVFRACLSAKTLSRLEELGWQNENRNAAVAAIRAIDGQEEQARSFNADSPRLTIVIRAPDPEPAVTTIEAKPLELEPAEPKRDRDGYLVDRDGRRIFDPFRDR